MFNFLKRKTKKTRVCWIESELVDLSAELKLNDSNADVVSRFIKQMLPNIKMGEGDTCDVSYRFEISYLDSAADRLRAWIDLLRSGVVVQANFESLTKVKLKGLTIVQLIDSLLAELSKQEDQNESIQQSTRGQDGTKA